MIFKFWRKQFFLGKMFFVFEENSFSYGKYVFFLFLTKLVFVTEKYRFFEVALVVAKANY